MTSRFVELGTIMTIIYTSRDRNDCSPNSHEENVSCKEILLLLSTIGFFTSKRCFKSPKVKTIRVVNIDIF